ncbi:MAG TPA: class I SAM-dependent methyltransferase [Gemmatimonadaceae bacterium]|nr:class I SAM-dependent methyltransferase [Gemmatimonadaceae bacterium]
MPANANYPLRSWSDTVRWLREQPGQAELVRDAYYDDPLVDAAERYRSSEEWREIRSWLPLTPASALDVGAGRGIASYALGKEGFTVTALEPDASSLTGAQAIRSLADETALPITVVEEFSEKLPFPDGSFDLVFTRAVLHHTRDLGRACAECFRVLKPGGRFIAIREHVISRPEDRIVFLDRHPLHKLYGGENAFLLHDYTQALTAAGFVIRYSLKSFDTPVNYFPYTRDTLRAALLDRIDKTMRASAVVGPLLKNDILFAAVLRVLSLVDRRPGRLHSFVCDKPAHAQ